MKRPPNIAVTGIVAVITFSAILLVRYLTQPAPPSPWRTDEAAAFAEAREQGKGVVIDFTADWSVPSVELSEALDKARAELDPAFVPLRIDISKGDDASLAISVRYGGMAPGVAFVRSDGTVLRRDSSFPDSHTVRDLIDLVRN